MTIAQRPEGGATPRSLPAVVIREVDPSSGADTAWAAQLHQELFADIGMVAKLGQPVLQEFCYGRLIQDGLMRAAIAIVDGQPAGLMVFTTDTQAIFRAVLRSHFFPTLRVVTVAAMTRPKILLRLPGAARLVLQRHRERLERNQPVAEVLCFGVKPEFRSHDFIRTTGIRVSDRLLYHTLLAFKNLGIPKGRGVIMVRNRPALAFMRMRAADVRPYPNASEPSVEVTYYTDQALELMDRHRHLVSDPVSD